MSTLGVLWLIGLGIYWFITPPCPVVVAAGREVVAARRLGTGVTLIVSGLIAGAMVVYSYLNFREIKEEQREEQAQETHQP